jgi:hypothetical protein
MSDVLFIADFFANHIAGGGELCNDALIIKLRDMGHKVKTAQSHLLSDHDLASVDNIIVANFVNLPERHKHALNAKKYVIYEHDHKYLTTRDPSKYSKYLVPEHKIINKEFYKNARAVFCQTDFHADIVSKNLKLNNIVSVGGNMWSPEHLEFLEKTSHKPKTSANAIMNSMTPHKNTSGAVHYCEALGLDYILLPRSSPLEFLEQLGSHSTLIFFPKTPETLSRIVVEARMMGMKTKTTNNIGAVHEDWFSLKGAELVKYMRDKQEVITNTILRAFHE